MAKRSPPCSSLAFSEQILWFSGEIFPTALFAVLATVLTFPGDPGGKRETHRNVLNEGSIFHYKKHNKALVKSWLACVFH